MGDKGKKDKGKREDQKKGSYHAHRHIFLYTDTLKFIYPFCRQVFLGNLHTLNGQRQKLDFSNGSDLFLD